MITQATRTGSQGPLERVLLRASDGAELVGDLHHPRGPVRGAAVFAPAMGVRRGFYRAFASYLSEAGLAVLCADYRGIGDSRVGPVRDSAATLTQWADYDLTAVTYALRDAYPRVPLHWVGHSLGGQLLGLLLDARFERALFIGSQSGYWRHWSGARRLAMGALWHVVLPTLVATTGLLPMRALGQGEDVPAGVAREWARWGRTPDYNAGFARARGTCGFDRFAGSLRAYAFSDDVYAPPVAVDALVREFRTPRKELVTLHPRDLSVPAIGHFGVMRSAFRDSLWSEMRAWLLADDVAPVAWGVA